MDDGAALSGDGAVQVLGDITHADDSASWIRGGVQQTSELAQPKRHEKQSRASWHREQSLRDSQAWKQRWLSPPWDALKSAARRMRAVISMPSSSLCLCTQEYKQKQEEEQ